MRIISGAVRGRRLIAPPGRSVTIRPTSDRAREALFSIIGRRIQNANILDLFAGTGAIGLEAFSRNAGCVIFVENNAAALKILKKNILLCHTGYSGSCEIRVIKHDLSHSLPLAHFPEQSRSKFDLIFADPPYSKNLSLTTLNLLNRSRLLAPNGLLVVEDRYDVDLPASFSNIMLIDKRTYGEASFWFFEPARHK